MHFLLLLLQLTLVISTGSSPGRGSAPLDDQSVVRIETGLVQGAVVGEGLRVYRGIPYASPPTGEWRWRAPRPAQAWEGVRPSTEFGKACPQSPLIAFLSGEALPETSEDCLTLNVWTRAASAAAKLPVLVWIHGGGLIGGWGHQKVCDGAALAERGVVFVSLNYRLGPLGFFAHPELSAECAQGVSGNGVSGNYGLLDQLAALRWVQRNIGAFGGDPGCVTIFGESAGATSVMTLLASPLARGLFQRAIAQSAWATAENFVRLGASEEKGRELQALLIPGVMEQGLARLRALPPDDLWRRLEASYQPAIVVDGWLLEDYPEEVFTQGRQQDVPLIAGTTADEGTAFVDLFPWKTADAQALGLQELYGPDAEEILGLYGAFEDRDVASQLNRWITDDWFLRPTRAMLQGMRRVSSKAWQYEFARISQTAPALGAHHAVEVPYVFGTLDKGSAVDKRLSATILDTWVHFARTGDPNAAGLPVWPSFGPEEKYLRLDQEITVGSALRKEACSVLERIRAKSRTRPASGRGG